MDIKISYKGRLRKLVGGNDDNKITYLVTRKEQIFLRVSELKHLSN